MNDGAPDEAGGTGHEDTPTLHSLRSIVFQDSSRLMLRSGSWCEAVGS
jgi:hypothetical protein